MKYRVNYTITGSYTVDEENYDPESFEGLSKKEKLEAIAETEEENNLGDIDILAESKLEVKVSEE